MQTAVPVKEMNESRVEVHGLNNRMKIHEKVSRNSAHSS